MAVFRYIYELFPFISKDTATFPYAENLYLMIDVSLVDPEKTPTPTSTPETSEDESDDPDDPGMTEVRFVPDNKDKLQVILKAMSYFEVFNEWSNGEWVLALF